MGAPDITHRKHGVDYSQGPQDNVFAALGQANFIGHNEYILQAHAFDKKLCTKQRQVSQI